MSRPTLIVHEKSRVLQCLLSLALQVAVSRWRNRLSLKCGLFQVIEVWHA